MKEDDMDAVAPPARLLSRTGGDGGVEDRLASLMRSGTATDGLAPAARARVWQRLDERERRTRPLATLRWSFALGVLLASGGVIAAMSAPRWWPKLLSPHVESPPAPAPAAVPARPRAQLQPPSVEAPAIETPPAVQDAPVVAPSAMRASAPARRAPGPSAPEARGPRPEALPTPPPEARSPRPETLEEPSAPEARGPRPEARAAPSALAAETALLADALTKLRHGRDPAAALAALDAYDASAPRGTLRREADGARVDALIMLGRDGDALAVLRTLALQPRGRDQELRVVRGELAAAADCAGAVDDFDRVLAEGPPARLVERALHGRATCLARLGDPEAARRDLLEYLRRFPDGRFAAEARRLAGDGAP